MSVEALYHVPRSQVWPGSRGRQAGHVHLHVDGRALCGRSAWWARELDSSDTELERCPRCAAKAAKLELVWPELPRELLAPLLDEQPIVRPPAPRSSTTLDFICNIDESAGLADDEASS